MTLRLAAGRLLTPLMVAAVTLAAPGPAAADNQMGYRLQTVQQSESLQRAGGSLGMKVGPEKEITSGGMTFELLKVEGVAETSAASQAGLRVGDQIIAVDGRVFPSVAVFAAYVGSVAPGRRIEVDYMPAGGGPKEAQRVGVTVGEGSRTATPRQDEPRRAGLSTGEKIAIGAGAVAVIGCYEAGCYTRLKKEYDAERAKHQQSEPVAPKP